ncbi:MAG TPA: hypothetical protein PKA29_02545 [Candidatus Saccharibacteria bacterium]|nr:hypothetical protein [Candidatus Saccharibacteria bacterium]
MESRIEMKDSDPREKLGRHRELLIDPKTLVDEAAQSWYEQSQNLLLNERKKYPGITEATEIGWLVVEAVYRSNNMARWVNRHGRLPRLNRHKWPEGEIL